MRIQPNRTLATAFLAIPLVSPVLAQSDFSANAVVSSLRHLDANLSQIQTYGFGSWLSQQAANKVPNLFGGMSDAAQNAQTVATHLYEIDTRGLTVIQSGWDAVSGGSPASIRSAQTGQDKFWDWLSQDKAPEMAKDALQMTLRESLRKMADGAESVYKNSEWLADKTDAVMSNVSDYSAQMSDRVRSYFSRDASYGLEPGSVEAQQARTLNDPGSPRLAESADEPVQPDATTTVQADSSGQASANTTTTAQAPTNEAASTPAPRHAATATPQEDDMAADLKGAGWDSGNLNNDPNAISADDLAQLRGGGDVSSADQLDASRLQSDLHDWNQQQEAERQAREAEQARLAALQAQRQAEEEAERESAARRAQQEAQADADRESATVAGSHPGSSWLDVIQQGLHVAQSYDAARHHQPDLSSTNSAGSGGSCNGAGAGLNQCMLAGSTCTALAQARRCILSAQSSCGSCGSCNQMAQSLLQQIHATSAGLCGR